MPNVSPGLHAMRRGGARQTVSERVTFKSPTGDRRQGWALNEGRGGLRAILDEGTGKVELGEEYEITVGDPDVDPGSAKHGRIVWLQEEPDGFVVGIEYLGLSGTHAAVPLAPASATSLGADASGENPASRDPDDAARAGGAGAAHQPLSG
jgi:hypothetical protein